MPLSDAELYKGLNKEKFDRYEQEARQAYGINIVSQTDRTIRNQTKPQWEKITKESSIITRNLAKRMDKEPGDPDVQKWIARQHTWIENFYPASAEVFRGLGDLYAKNEEFRAFYDQYKPGLADFMQQAMHHYADTTLSEAEKQN